MHRATEHFSCTDETAFQPKTHEASNPMVVSKYVDCAESEGQVTANVESGKTPPACLQTVSHYFSTMPPNELLIYFPRVTTNHYMRFEYDTPAVSVNGGCPYQQVDPTELPADVSRDQRSLNPAYKAQCFDFAQ